MANLRESYAATSMASLKWSPERERAIDRVAAGGKVSALGLALWKAQYMLEAAAYNDAKAALLKLYRARYTREDAFIAGKVGDQALHEFLSPFCIVCDGTKEVEVDQIRAPCAACLGVGVRRYTDIDRARTMQISYGLTKRLAHKIQWLLGEMSGLSKDVNQVLAEQLERG